MSAIEPKPLRPDLRAALRAAGVVPYDDLKEALLWYRDREAHVIAVLRQAERCGGGYGFVTDLLRYLGADQEEEQR